MDTSVNVPEFEKFIHCFGGQIACVFNNAPGEDTNASLTTAPESLNAVLRANTIYTLTFTTASQSGAAINYHVQLLAINHEGKETVFAAASGSVRNLRSVTSRDTPVTNRSSS